MLKHEEADDEDCTHLTLSCACISLDIDKWKAFNGT